MAPKVLISDDLSPAAIAIFKERGVEVDVKIGLPKDELERVVGGYDGLAIRSATKVTEKVIAAAARLKVVGRAGIGVDNVDVKAATQKGIIVMNTPFGNSITTAEHAISLMLALARQIPQANASTHSGKWEKSKFMGVEVYGKTLGIVGCGNIGSIVADRAIGLRMKVIAYDPFLSTKRAVEIGAEEATAGRRAASRTCTFPLAGGTSGAGRATASRIGRARKTGRTAGCSGAWRPRWGPTRHRSAGRFGPVGTSEAGRPPRADGSAGSRL